MTTDKSSGAVTRWLPTRSRSFGVVAASAALTLAGLGPASSADSMPPPVRSLGTVDVESQAIAVDGHVALVRAGGRALAYDLDSDAITDLGSLAGSGATPTALDGDIVVGTSSAAPGYSHPLHAFAYDLRTERMRDLGTLGGRQSWATDVDGDIVVGWSFRADKSIHAFAYDLRTRTMQDLGTLGGNQSEAVAVAGDVVVGWSFLPADPEGIQARHAFAYDLRTGRMRDLGTLGGQHSEPRAVDGDIVVGTSHTTSYENSRHAFAYDLRTDTMRDLGTLGGMQSGAVDVDGDIVVGRADTAGRPGGAFAYDLGTGAMRDLGVLEWGTSSAAVAVDGHIVVGKSTCCGEEGIGFAYDLRTDTMHRLDAGLGGDASSVTAVDGGVVVGSFSKYRPDRTGEDLLLEYQLAAAWSLGVGFDSTRTRVVENAGAVELVVERGGDTSMPTTVDYARSSGTATPGTDFTLEPGTLTFAAGETTKTIPLIVTDDGKREPRETIVVSLTPRDESTMMGTPTATTVTIRPSDQRPDGQISTRPSSGFIGNNVYNTNGAEQSKRLSAERGQTRTFYVRVYNDGNARNTFTLTGSRPPRGSRVRFFMAGKDVTAAMRTEAGLRLTRAPGGFGLVTVRIKVRTNAGIGTWKKALVRATWNGDVRRTDTVRAAVHVIRG